MPAITLGQRLAKLKESIGPDYDHIWDCCCDHGHLGISLIQSNTAPHIHFVDCVPQIIEDLNSKLPQLISGTHSQWQTLCIDASKLEIESGNEKHLIVIAGIGGDLMLQMIKSINDANPSITLDYLLCPIRQLYKLRSELHALQFKVRKENLVEENKRIYEVILVSDSKLKASNRDDLPLISKTGEDIWKTDKGLARKYFAEISTHYQKRLISGDSELRQILREYKNAAQSDV